MIELDDLIKNIDILKNSKVTYKDTTFIAWKQTVTMWIINNYGKDSFVYDEFKKIKFYQETSKNLAHYILVEECAKGLELVKAILNNLPERIFEKSSTPLNNKVFVVHGHKKLTRLEIKDFLRDCGLEPIVLSDQTNGGTTALIDKFERESKNVSAAIILFTGDDKGASCKDLNSMKSTEDKIKKLRYRARQNVVFEAGYFMGKLGKGRVIIFTDKKNIEFPGDIANTVYITKDNWKNEIRQELCQMGLRLSI